MGRTLDWNREGANWPMREASRFVAAGGLRWHVQVMGAGPVLLLVHGTGASTHSWRRLMPLLAPHFTLVVPDLPGHGFTETPLQLSLTLPGMACSLTELMRQMSMEPAVVAGHSAGAAILIRACLDGGLSPKCIVSLNGALLAFDGLAGHLFKPLAKFLALQPFVPFLVNWRAGNRTAVARLLEGTGSSLPSEDIELYARLFESPRHVAATLAMMANWDLAPLARDIRQLDVPLLLAAGARDLAIKPADALRVSQLARNAVVETLPGLGHLAHEENPQAVCDLIRRFAGLHVAARSLD